MDFEVSERLVGNFLERVVGKVDRLDGGYFRGKVPARKVVATSGSVLFVDAAYYVRSFRRLDAIARFERTNVRRRMTVSGCKRLNQEKQCYEHCWPTKLHFFSDQSPQAEEIFWLKSKFEMAVTSKLLKDKVFFFS